MFFSRFFWLVFWAFIACGSGNDEKVLVDGRQPATTRMAVDTVPPVKVKPKPILPETAEKQEAETDGKPSSHTPAPSPTPLTRTTPATAGAPFLELIDLAPSIKLDIRYATSNNFTHSKIYDCARCYLRPEAAKAIARAQESLKKVGLGLKMFDCYRPAPYQQRLWDKVPNPNYVTPPSKGSMHSRGAAVDLTLIDLKTGKELDMGTPYDFFGPEAHTDYTKHPQNVLDNRQKLRSAMEAVGFQGIRTEWWHFSYREKTYPLDEWVWECK